MEILAEVSRLSGKINYFSSLVFTVHRLLRTPPHSDPEGFIRRQLANRKKSFLELMRQVVFSNPANPYHQMFRLAGCRHEDLAEAVNRDGIESTLALLHRQGVYLAHDEFKGKKPIVRSNRQIPSEETSFRNPLVKRGLVGSSGGSRSRGTPTRWSIPALLHREAHQALAIREFALGDRCRVRLTPVLPAAAFTASFSSYSRLGCPVARWFSPVAASFDSTHYRWATHFLVILGRLHGERVPFPVCLPPNDYSPVASWIAQRRQEGILCSVDSHASPAVRVAAAAAEKGLDIRDTQFLIGGETLTDAKRRVIEGAGAQVFPRYPISEIGLIGSACRKMTRGNCVHVFADAVAVISYPRPAPLSGVEVESLLFTTLLPYGPYVLINAEMDDSGILDKASCDCTFSAVGLTQQIRDINSYGKLTGHGVTLVGTDVVRILEEVLPSQFGGCATDYQLVERDADNQACLTLRVSRRVPLPSPDRIRECFLRWLPGVHGGQIASWLWRDAAAVEVVHEEPITTPRGKVLPLYLLSCERPRTYGS
jgi:hypothetical protein